MGSHSGSALDGTVKKRRYLSSRVEERGRATAEVGISGKVRRRGKRALRPPLGKGGAPWALASPPVRRLEGRCQVGKPVCNSDVVSPTPGDGSAVKGSGEVARPLV